MIRSAVYTSLVLGRGLAHTLESLTSSSSTLRGCPTRRGFRRVGTTDPYSLGSAISHYATPRTRISAICAALTSTGPRSPQA